MDQTCHQLFFVFDWNQIVALLTWQKVWTPLDYDIKYQKFKTLHLFTDRNGIKPNIFGVYPWGGKRSRLVPVGHAERLLIDAESWKVRATRENKTRSTPRQLLPWRGSTTQENTEAQVFNSTDELIMNNVTQGLIRLHGRKAETLVTSDCQQTAFLRGASRRRRKVGWMWYVCWEKAMANTTCDW